MTKLDLKQIILECLNESDIPIGGLVGRVPLSNLPIKLKGFGSKREPDISEPDISEPESEIKLTGFYKSDPDPNLQSKLKSLESKYQDLDIYAVAYKDYIHLKQLVAKENAPKGTGSSYMNDLTQLADKNKVMITLTPAEKGSFGRPGFKKTSSYSRLVAFYKRFGFKSKYSTKSYRPDLADVMFREPRGINERYNEKVGPYEYYGFGPDDEDNIKKLVNTYHLTNDGLTKERIQNHFETLYYHLVGRNPVLSKIDIDISDYKGKNTAMMDLVYGAVSGIPPEDIKNYIEQTKGAGGTSIPTGYVLDPNASNYVKIKQLN